MKIAILYDKQEKLYTTNWNLALQKKCKQNNISYKVVNPYKIGVIKSANGF